MTGFNDDNDNQLEMDKNQDGVISYDGGEVSYRGEVGLETLQSLQKQKENDEINAIYSSENKRKNGLLFNVGIVYLCVMILLIGIRIMSSLGVFSSLGIYGQTYVSSVIIQVLIMFAVPIIGFCIIKKQGVKRTLSDFQFKKISGKVVLISILIGVTVYFLNGFVSSIFAYILDLLGYETAPSAGSSVEVGATIWYFITTVICSCILPAICEETAHRGLLLNSLKRYGVGKAIIISGLLFGLIHLNINQFFYATFVGFILGAITIFSGSIYPAMIVHFMNNFLSTCSEFAYAYGVDYFSLSSLINYINNIFGAFVSNFVIFIVIIFCVFILAYLIYRLYVWGKFGFVFNKIKSRNLAYFCNVNNVDENGKIKLSAIRNFFGTDKIEQAVLVYLSNKSKDVPFWDNFDVVYSSCNRKGLLNWAFIIGVIVIGSLATIFTFVWGIL